MLNALFDFLFAVKEHWTKNKHYDLRFHRGGSTLISLVSYISPHRDPTHPFKVKRVENHNLHYLCSERLIPPDQPGAGWTFLWDKGYYRLLGRESMDEQLEKGHLRIEIFGERLKGRYCLKQIDFRDQIWIWAKEEDEFADRFLRFKDVRTPEKIMELETKGKSRNHSDELELFPV